MNLSQMISVVDEAINSEALIDIFYLPKDAQPYEYFYYVTSMTTRYQFNDYMRVASVLGNYPDFAWFCTYGKLCERGIWT